MTTARENSRISLETRCKVINWLLLDVDGVLTDGKLYYGESGEALKAFHVRDGAAIKLWRQAGKKVAVLSGRSSPALLRRCQELGIAPVLQGQADKKQAWESWIAQTAVRPGEVCYVGDDLPDLPVMERCGLAISPADGSPEVLAAADYVAVKTGGSGVVREVVEMILRCQGCWNSTAARLAGV